MMKHMHSRPNVFLVILILLVTLSCFSISFAYEEELSPIDNEIAYDDENNPYRSGQLIVGYNQETPAESKRSLRAQMQLELKTELHGVNADVIKVKKENTKEILAQLKKDPNVVFAEYDYLTVLDYIPNDPYYSAQLYLPYMNAPEAWNYTKGSSSITVAVLDSGLTTNNTDLKNLNVSGYNIVSSSSNYTDDNSHGTAVASVIAAKMDNAFGFAGISPNSTFLILKVISSDGTGTYSDMIRGIEYASNSGAKVINMSMGGRAYSDALKLAVDNAFNNGVTIVAAAGNEGTTTVSFPAAFNNVVGVGAVDLSGNKMTYSNTGSGLTVVAGGTAKVATFSDFISSGSGTSFASPYVAGMVSLMYASDSNMNPEKVFNILSQTSKDLGSSGYDTTFGYGLVNMGEAVRMSTSSDVPPPPTVDTTAPVLTLIGANSMTLEKGNSYTEQGANAIDDVDGDLTASIVISGNVDVTTAGIYELTYSVKDQAGNISNIEKRTIEITEPVAAPIDIPIETHFIRDVEILQGSLSRRTPLATHIIQIKNPGQLDIELTYVGKVAPKVAITGLNFNGTSGVFQVAQGNYTMTLNSTVSLKYSVTLTYPEREVPIDVPAGPPEVIIYDEGFDYTIFIYLTVILLLMLTLAYFYKSGKINLFKR